MENGISKKEQLSQPKKSKLSDVEKTDKKKKRHLKKS
jgi:hypothetical protein